MDKPLAKKTVNALITDAEVSSGAGKLADAAGVGAVGAMLAGLKMAMGGLWVGGTASLYDTRLVFQPNAMNRTMHAGDCSAEVPLAEITDIQVRKALATNIIDLVTDDQVLSIRCYGAEGFANAIRAQQASVARAA